MKSASLLPLSLLLAGCSTLSTSKKVVSPIPQKTVHHPLFVPKYDFAGSWSSSGSAEHSHSLRHGRHVYSTFNTGDYEHVFEGDYVNEQTITGIQTRRKRSDGTVTRMQITVYLLSQNEGRVTWIALDSNSDLVSGQTGSCVINRVSPAQ